ncbi:MAG: hypothetical protein IPM54_29315 [Polyangiaceae bacterium]|nr:hypothetical protein [Polyangiaceae bacterium]
MASELCETKIHDVMLLDTRTFVTKRLLVVMSTMHHSVTFMTVDGRTCDCSCYVTLAWSMRRALWSNERRNAELPARI